MKTSGFSRVVKYVEPCMWLSLFLRDAVPGSLEASTLHILYTSIKVPCFPKSGGHIVCYTRYSNMMNSMIHGRKKDGVR